MGPFWGREAVSSSLLLLGAGLAVVVPLTVVCFCTSSCGSGGLSAACPAAGYPYGVKQTFLAPVACPAPAVELCLLGLRCLWCGAWFSTLCGAFLPGPAVLGSFPYRLPVWVLPLYAWPATTPVASVGLHPSLCVLSASPAPAGLLEFAGFLHPVSGSSQGGCDCSLGDSVGVPFGSPFLLSFASCSVISSCGSHPLWVLFSVHCLVSLALGRVRFWPSVSPVPVRCGVCCLGCPLVVDPPSPALVMGWFGHTSVAPPAAPVCWALVGSVALFCRLGLLCALPCRVFACGFPWFRGPSSWCFLGLFTVVLSSRFHWLRMAWGGCCLRFVQGPLPQAGAVFLACVSLGGCPSSQVGPARSHWVPLLWSWCACGLPQFSSCVFLRDVVTCWVNRVFLSLLIANEGLHCWLFLFDFANSSWWRIVVLLCPPSVGRRFLWLVAALLSGLSLSFASGLLLLVSAAASLCALGVLTGCPCGCASTVCWAVGFPGLLAGHSLSSLLWFSRLLSVFFSHMVHTLRDGVTPVGSRQVCPRSERRFVCFPFPFGAVSSCRHCPWGFGHHMGQCVGWFQLLHDAIFVGATHFLLLEVLPASVCGSSLHPVALGWFPGGPSCGRESSVVFSSLQRSSL